MKTRLSVFAFLFFMISNVDAQDDVPEVFNMNTMDTVWQAKNNKVCKKDTATYYKLYRISDEPGLYTVNQYFVTGELYMTGRVTSVKPEHRDGDFYWFYKNGGKQKKVTYKKERIINTVWWDTSGVKKIPAAIPRWTKDNKLDIQETLLDKAAEFPGGEVALVNYILKETNYPNEAKMYHAEGRVIVRMIIDESGRVSYSEVVKKINPYLEAEALRVVRRMPKWSPAMNDGKPVSVVFIMPVVFTLRR